MSHDEFVRVWVVCAVGREQVMMSDRAMAGHDREEELHVNVK
jgi:hypothetical protein